MQKIINRPKIRYVMMQVGLLGKANVGKSTFFAASTESDVATGNYPFTTISPNVGVSHVRVVCACRHFGIEHSTNTCNNGIRLVPIKLIDVAGLVPGAHTGKGLGNQFLDDARQASILVHVVDVAGSTDIQGQPVPPGTHDPAEDVKFIQEEFDMWFLNIIKREWDKLCREVNQKRVKVAEGITNRFTGLGVRQNDVQSTLQELNLISKAPKDWSDDEIYGMVRHLRRITKPILVAANKADLADDPNILGESVPCSAETELILRRAAKAGIISYTPGDSSFEYTTSEISVPQQKALNIVKSVLNKLGSTGIQRVLNSAVFDRMSLITAYPVEDETRLTNKDGVVLPDVLLLPRGSSAKDLAYMVHTDIGESFLYGIDCKTHQRIGAEHIIQDGDVIKIVSAGAKN